MGVCGISSTQLHLKQSPTGKNIPESYLLPFKMSNPLVIPLVNVYVVVFLDLRALVINLFVLRVIIQLRRLFGTV